MLSVVTSDTRKHQDVFLRNIAPTTLKKIMGKAGWSCLEQGFFDVPPWPDIAMKKEDLLRKLGFKELAKKLESREGNSICILDYYNGSKKKMAENVLKYDKLENLPNVFKQLWAHHQYFMFIPR